MCTYLFLDVSGPSLEGSQLTVSNVYNFYSSFQEHFASMLAPPFPDSFPCIHEKTLQD